jgi:hypothetical protein
MNREGKIRHCGERRNPFRLCARFKMDTGLRRHDGIGLAE